MSQLSAGVTNGRVNDPEAASGPSEAPNPLTRRLLCLPVGTQITLALLVMLVPMVIVGTIGILAVDRTTSGFQGSSGELIREIQEVAQIREALTSIEETTDEFAEQGGSKRQYVLEQKIAILDGALALDLWDEPAERQLLKEATRQWQLARADIVERISTPSKQREGMDEDFHARIHNTRLKLNELDSFAIDEGADELANIYTGADRRRQLSWVGLLVALSAAAGLLLARRLRRAMLKPLAVLQTAAREFGRDNLDYRADTTRDDEFGQAANALNRMADKLKHSREELRQSQRLDAIGQLAGGVAHDFNNVLSVIQNYAAFLAEELEGNERLMGDLREIEIATSKAVALTRQLLTFSRKDEAVASQFDPNAAIRETEGLITAGLSEDIDIQFSLAPDIRAIEMDPSQFDQILLNLAVNARDAMPSGGILMIETSHVRLMEGGSWDGEEVPAGEYVCIAVSDTGTGMSEEVRSRIFEPFYTTKERGKGTGLGLATVYGVVKKLGGTISVYSEPGVGTTFKLYLPVATKDAELVIEERSDAARSGEGCTVLVVEDEGGVRRVAHRILAKAGYDVLSTESPMEALEIQANFDGHIDLLLTDVIMPGMNGKELVQRIHVSRPTLPVIYMSGYTEGIVSARGLLKDEWLLQKPFSSASLLMEVELALDTRKPELTPA